MSQFRFYHALKSASYLPSRFACKQRYFTPKLLFHVIEQQVFYSYWLEKNSLTICCPPVSRTFYKFYRLLANFLYFLFAGMTQNASPMKGAWKYYLRWQLFFSSGELILVTVTKAILNYFSLVSSLLFFFSLYCIELSSRCQSRRNSLRVYFEKKINYSPIFPLKYRYNCVIFSKNIVERKRFN